MATDGEQLSEAPARTRRVASRFGRMAFALLAALLAALIVLWLVRKPIATHFIDRTLATSKVPARYEITDLGFGAQRLTNVVIGDPAHPDLVADWIETRTSIGLSGAEFAGVRAGHVRLRARLVGGRVSLGAIDRLLPPPSGKPFALPALDVAVEDARMRLETPQGIVGLRLSGSGRLDDGFEGDLAVVSDRLQASGCTVRRMSAAVRIAIADAAPRLIGPVRAGAIDCGGVAVARLGSDVDVTLSPALDHWHGNARLASGAAQAPGARARSLSGTIDFAGDARATKGTLDLAATGATTQAGTAQRLALKGAYHVGHTTGFSGTIGLAHAALSAQTMVKFAALDGGAGTPIAPLLRAAKQAVGAAARDVSGQGDVTVDLTGGKGTARVSKLALSSASGARIALTGGSGIAYGWPNGGLRLDIGVTTAGGGLPEARIVLAQTAPGAPVRGTATIQPYAAGDARLALTPVSFSAGAEGLTRIATIATLSGPLGNGRVDSLSLPIDARWDGRGALAIDGGCAPLSWQSINISGLTLQPGRLALCPTGTALVRIANGRIDGGARIGAARLVGRLGETPLTLAATGAELSLGRYGFALRGVETRIGSPDRVTRLDFAAVAGRLDGAAVTGTFGGGAGQIANVPLLLAEAEGEWTLRDGALRLIGALKVHDAADDARFQPLEAHDVTLALVDSHIAASGTLFEPSRQVKVADVRIDHALSSGTGDATLTVPNLAFTEDFQPELLTRLTFGVIADVRGTVTGEGHIAWNGDGVTSTGTFATDGTDLAAAFGPVTGISGTIHFTDLLALASAPGQVATIKTINPGIPVTDGRIVYQTYPDSRVLVNGGRWPFAGGTLSLEPTLLDFSAQQVRHMTFRVAGMQADQFLQQFDFDNLDATGTFDGVLPMVFDEDGGKISGGDLTVREGGGTLAYVGDLTQKDLGFWSNLAFQALKSLRYRSLSIGMNGPLAGEMVTDVRFAGISQGEGAKSNFLVRRLQRLPFVFNIRIKAPFRGLLDSAQSFYDPKRLIQRNLPQLLQQQNQAADPAKPAPVPNPTPTPIQPSASRIVP